jgi:hypothetical protein
MKGASSMNAPKQQPGAIIDPSLNESKIVDPQIRYLLVH